MAVWHDSFAVLLAFIFGLFWLYVSDCSCVCLLVCLSIVFRELKHLSWFGLSVVLRGVYVCFRTMTAPGRRLSVCFVWMYFFRVSVHWLCVVRCDWPQVHSCFSLYRPDIMRGLRRLGLTALPVECFFRTGEGEAGRGGVFTMLAHMGAPSRESF